MTKQQGTHDRVELNDVVRQLARVDRAQAVAILARYGALTTPEVKPEEIPAAHAAFEEALAKLNGKP
jgi:hypothetical protein